MSGCPCCTTVCTTATATLSTAIMYSMMNMHDLFENLRSPRIYRSFRVRPSIYRCLCHRRTVFPRVLSHNRPTVSPPRRNLLPPHSHKAPIPPVANLLAQANCRISAFQHNDIQSFSITCEVRRVAPLSGSFGLTDMISICRTVFPVISGMFMISSSLALSVVSPSEGMAVVAGT